MTSAVAGAAGKASASKAAAPKVPTKAEQSAVGSKEVDDYIARTSGKTSPASGGPAPKKAAPKKSSAKPAQPSTSDAGSQPTTGNQSSGLSIGPPKMPSGPGVPSVVNTGAGFVLGLLFWTWVALPFLNGNPGGVQGVKNMLKAKFLNKAPDGSWLP